MSSIPLDIKPTFVGRAMNLFELSMEGIGIVYQNYRLIFQPKFVKHNIPYFPHFY